MGDIRLAIVAASAAAFNYIIILNLAIDCICIKLQRIPKHTQTRTQTILSFIERTQLPQYYDLYDAISTEFVLLDRSKQVVY